MTDIQNISYCINEIFQTAFKQPKLMVHSKMITGDLPGWDSFKNVEILMACETRFGIRFRSKEIDAITSVGDLIAACEQKLHAA
jgi:acyl carrier protein